MTASMWADATATWADATATWSDVGITDLEFACEWSPATDPNFLTEFTGYGLASLGDFNEAGMTSAPNTPRVPTLISYATDDTRVGYTESETLATTVGADTIVYSSLGHNTTDATNRALFDWLKTISI